MRNKNQKGKCVKLTLPYFDGVVKTYDDLQLAAAKLLSANSDFVSIQSNVDCVEVDGTKYTTDFVCQSKDGKYSVFECVYRKQLDKPKMMKLLDASQQFWTARGVEWGLISKQVINPLSATRFARNHCADLPHYIGEHTV